MEKVNAAEPERPITILAIESSCDETSCAICRDGVILSNIIAGQAIHEQYGGVVPELASRAHMQNIVPVVDAALKKADCGLETLTAIAFTQSPGLIGSLLVGSQFAKSLAQALGIPLLAVHHMQAHVIANLISGPVMAAGAGGATGASDGREQSAGAVGQTGEGPRSGVGGVTAGESTGASDGREQSAGAVGQTGEGPRSGVGGVTAGAVGQTGEGPRSGVGGVTAGESTGASDGQLAAGRVMPASTVGATGASSGAVGATKTSPGRPEFPFLCLTVSGGHTQIVLCHSPLQMEVIGETLDDAAGEAFDKSAKLLGLPYPGGPLIDKYAREGNPTRFTFPEPQIPGLNFSFSGLKTAILYFLQDQTAKDPDFIGKNLNDICASIQSRIISILLNKFRKAAQQTGVKNLCIAGGVSANSGLRAALREMGERQHWNTFIPPFEYCTDNAAMIAMTGYYKYLAGDRASLSVSASARAEW